MMDKMYWFADDSIEIVKVDGKLFALDGWNGEKYLRCWKCTDKYTVADYYNEYVVKPVYKENADGNFDIVGYEVE